MKNGRLYIVSPACGLPLPYEAEVLREAGGRPAAFMASLALPTLAACAPEDFPVDLCDERISPVDLDHPAELVFITCNSRQYERARKLCGEFRRRGKIVAVGGPFATLVPEALRPFCDILFKGELEDAAAAFFEDFRSGRRKEEYDGGWADLERSPVPRWDLYPNDRTLIGAVQTSRGCPFDCSFCEVIEVYGRKPRLKKIGQVLRELDQLYRLGYRSVFFTDDNFIAIPPRAKELLAALAQWNAARKEDPVQFYTQLTLTAARDEELLRLCARAGLVNVYIGVESPDMDSLKEAVKRPNIHLDIAASLRRFYAHGISVLGSMIIGFDSDGPEVFERQERFITQVPLPLVQIGPLVLTRGTPLHAKFQAQKRLGWEWPVAGQPWVTNLMPLQMTREALLAGIQTLSYRLYRPEAFAARLGAFFDLLGGEGDAVYALAPGPKAPAAAAEAARTVRRMLSEAPELAPLKSLLESHKASRERLGGWVLNQVVEYLQMRLVFKAPLLTKPDLAVIS